MIEILKIYDYKELIDKDFTQEGSGCDMIQ